MQQDDQQQRQALVEGFVDMSDMGALREDQTHHHRIFTNAGKSGTGTDYVEMDDDAFLEEGEGGEGGKLGAGQLKENTNIFKSGFHVFKANVGTGVFMIPTFYKDAGYVVSVILAILIGCLVVDCTNLLLKVKLTINRRDVTTYSQLCRFVMGPALGWYLFVALCLTQFGFCLMFSQLFSATMEQLVPMEKGQYLWVSLVLIICFPITCFGDNLSLLSISSIIATIGVFYALICCLIENFMKIAEHGGKPHPTCNVAGSSIPIGWFNNLANNMMVLEGIAIVLPVHSACTQKRLVPRMITIVLCCVICWYLLFGLTGYLAFGREIQNSLVNAMDMNAWGKSIRGFFVVNVILSYPLQFMSAMQLIDQIAGCRPRSLIGIGIRLFINLIVWALAMAVPSSAVDVVVAFIGALPSTWMVIILPCVLSLQVKYACEHPDENRNSWHYWKIMMFGQGRPSWLRIRCYIYLVIALLIMVIGTYSIVIFQILGKK